MSKKIRRRHTPDQQLSLLKKHHMERIPVSEVCDGAQVQPSLFYTWQKRRFENGAVALEDARQAAASSSREKELLARIEQLEAKLAKKNSVIAEISAEYVQPKKRVWGALKGRWVPHDVRDEVIDFVRELSERTEIPITRVLGWLPLSRSKYAEWKKRYGKANEHNGKVPRDFWIEEHERAAIIEFLDKNRSKASAGSPS
jgi:putative transposase